MVFKKLLRLYYKVIYEFCRFITCHPFSILFIFPTFFRFHQKRLPAFIRMVMWRSTFNMLVSALDDEQMPVLYSGNELDVLVA